MSIAGWSAVQRTLLIPLVGRARARRDFPKLGFADAISEQVVERLGSEAAGFEQDRNTVWGSIKRTQLFDRVVHDFIARHPHGHVLALGGGLCTRSYRLERAPASYIELEFPEVVEVKRALFPAPPPYLRWIEGSAADLALLQAALAGDAPVLVVAEGVLMFIDEADVRRILREVATRARPGSELLFDYIHPVIRRISNWHPSMRRAGARYHFGVRPLTSLLSDMPNARLIDARMFSPAFPGVARAVNALIATLARGPTYDVAHFALGEQ